MRVLNWAWWQRSLITATDGDAPSNPHNPLQPPPTPLTTVMLLLDLLYTKLISCPPFDLITKQNCEVAFYLMLIVYYLSMHYLLKLKALIVG